MLANTTYGALHRYDVGYKVANWKDRRRFDWSFAESLRKLTFNVLNSLALARSRANHCHERRVRYISPPFKHGLGHGIASDTQQLYERTNVFQIGKAIANRRRTLSIRPSASQDETSQQILNYQECSKW